MSNIDPTQNGRPTSSFHFFLTDVKTIHKAQNPATIMPSPSRSVEYDALGSFSSDDEESFGLIDNDASIKTLFDEIRDAKPRINRKICLSLLLSVVVLITLAHRYQNKAPQMAPHPTVDKRNPFESSTPPLVSDTRTSPPATPDIAWLMSYPNSGTSYTLRLIQMVSNTTAATNYGEECEKDTRSGRIAPLYGDSPSGPYLRHIDSKPLPDSFILTKTHCGGRCVHCAPDRYIETVDSFFARCLTGTLVEPTFDGSKEVNRSRVQYTNEHVKKAIHLVRDPFNNIVARFHLEYNNHKNLNNFSSSFPNNREGFRRWCDDLDQRYTRQENKTELISPDIKAQINSVPCHSEFYRYAQWHNLAIAVTENMSLETYVLHYENYEKAFEPVLKSMLRFLKLDAVGDISPFIAGKTYHDYYKKEELAAAMRLVKAVASNRTWTLVRRYEKSLEDL